MPRKPLTAAEAAAYAVLAYVAKLNLQKQDIKRGNYPVDLRITGTVAGYEIDIPIVGEGTQSGPQTTASSTGPSADELWAYARKHIPATRLPAIEDEAVALFAAEERLPGVDETDAKAAKPFLKKCRAAKSSIKAGAFAFCAAPDPDDLEAAMSRAA